MQHLSCPRSLEFSFVFNETTLVMCAHLGLRRTACLTRDLLQQKAKAFACVCSLTYSRSLIVRLHALIGPL